MTTINRIYIQTSSVSHEGGFSLIYSSCQMKQELICFNQIFCLHITLRSFFANKAYLIDVFNYLNALQKPSAKIQIMFSTKNI